MVKVIRPPEVLSDEWESVPVIFLAGPIQGAPNWHDEAICNIATAVKKFEDENDVKMDVIVASPKRLVWDHSVGNKEETYNEQVDWESEFLGRASDEGSMLFWLPKEVMHDENRAYAQTTRFELAEWLKWDYECLVVRSSISLGIEKGFSGERYIRRRCETCYTDINIMDNLKQVCENAVDYLVWLHD